MFGFDYARREENDKSEGDERKSNERGERRKKKKSGASARTLGTKAVNLHSSSTSLSVRDLVTKKKWKRKESVITKGFSSSSIP